MRMDKQTGEILRRRMHGLYLSRPCDSLPQLAGDLLGLHCWFHRNVAFSALIRGAGIGGWKTTLTKTWLYRGLHGALYDELPLLLAIETREKPLDWFKLSEAEFDRVTERVIALMEDGINSRAEMRKIFAEQYSGEMVARLFSPWGGVFVYLARRGQVAFQNMTSRDFDLISAEPTLTPEEALTQLLPRYFSVYGPAALADAVWFFGLDRTGAKLLRSLPVLDSLERLEWNGETLYYTSLERRRRSPHITLLSGFDPYLVSYTNANRDAMLPPEYKKAVVLSSGICLPTVAIDGRVAGLWNIKGKEPTVEFFKAQPKRVRNEVMDRVELLRRQTAGQI